MVRNGACARANEHSGCDTGARTGARTDSRCMSIVSLRVEMSFGGSNASLYFKRVDNSLIASICTRNGSKYVRSIARFATDAARAGAVLADVAQYAVSNENYMPSRCKN